MPWHLSKSDPRKVYDERHEPICVCQTPEQAARIVAAVTGKSQTVFAAVDTAKGHTLQDGTVFYPLKLKEPAAAMSPQVSPPFDMADGGAVDPGKTYLVGERVCETTITLTDSFEPDQGCCSAAIMSASRKGALKSATAWECPRCGCEWTPKSAGMFRYWSPVPDIAIIASRS